MFYNNEDQGNSTNNGHKNTNFISKCKNRTRETKVNISHVKRSFEKNASIIIEDSFKEENYNIILHNALGKCLMEIGSISDGYNYESLIHEAIKCATSDSLT